MDAKRTAIRVGMAAAIIAVVLAAGGCATAGVIDVGSQEVQELSDEGVRIIDVRTPGEYEAGHIPGAELVPVNDLPAEAAAWDIAEPVVIYCATGARSAQAVSYLAEQGFETIYHFASGIVSWEGDLERGTALSENAPPVEAPGVPVMYEFYTDS